MTDYEREDMELEAMMGSKFQNTTREPEKAEPEKVSECTTTARKPRQEAKCDVWSPFNAEPSFGQKLMNCAKWASLFSALCLLFFYWQQTGKMDASASVPCMCACTGMVGWSIGRYAFRGKR